MKGRLMDDWTQTSEDVLAASLLWIEAFNRGDVDACVAGYLADAVIEARPLGTFQGLAAIDGFWRPFMQQGAGALEYHDVHLRRVDAATVILSANWTMNVGAGIISCERWVKGVEHGWQLQEDRFEILEQY